MYNYIENVLQDEVIHEFPEVFETERLLFKHPPSEHYEISDFHNFVNSGEESRKMLGMNDLRPNAGREHSERIWELLNSRWHEEGVEFLCWFMELRDQEEQRSFNRSFIGLTNLRIIRRLRKAEMGIVLHPEFWGNEFSSERAKALVDLCFNSELDIDVVEISPQVDNTKSIKSVEKYIDDLNGRKVGRISNYQNIEGQGVVDSVLYQITKHQYNGD